MFCNILEGFTSLNSRKTLHFKTKKNQEVCRETNTLQAFIMFFFSGFNKFTVYEQFYAMSQNQTSFEPDNSTFKFRIGHKFPRFFPADSIGESYTG